MRRLLPALMLLGGCTHAAENARAYVYMDAVADTLASSAPKPRWEGSSPMAALDEATFLDDKHVVLGWDMNLSLDTMGFPIRMGLLEFNADAGKPLWSSRSLPINVRSIVAADSRRVLSQAPCSTATCKSLADRLYLVWDGPAIAGDTPIKHAHFRVEAGFRPSSASLTADDTKVVLLEQADLGGVLDVFDIDKGKVWEDIDRAAALAPSTMSVGDHDIAAWRSAVADYDSATGARVWTVAAPGLVTEGSELIRGDDVLMAMRGDGRIWILDARTGAVRAEADGLSRPAMWVASDSGIYELGSDLREILALRRADGAKLFRISLPAPANGAIAVGDGVIAVPVTTGVSFYSAKDGHALEVVLLDTGAPAHRLPDQMSVRGDTLIVAYETGVAAIDLRSRKPLWSYKVRGTPPTLLDQRLPQLLFELSDFGVSAPKDIESTLALRFVTATNHGTLTLQPIQGNASDGSFTLGNPRLSAGANRAAAAADFSMLVISTNLQVAAMAESHHATEVNALIGNAKFRLGYALRVFADALQGNYYVRPIGWLWGAGYFVVDLRNGTWTEILTSPQQHFQDDFSAAFPMGAISPRGDYLLTTAISFDRSHWVERTRDTTHPVFPIADEPRHLMRFDIPSGSFGPPSSYSARSIVNDRLVSSVR